MEFEGKVINKLAPVSGTSARGEWTKQEVIFEQSGEFGRKICVSFWGDKAQEAAGLNPGDSVKVAANVESREYNGRWYTEVRAWRISRAESGGAPPIPDNMPFDMPPANEMASGKEDFDDLPF